MKKEEELKKILKKYFYLNETGFHPAFKEDSTQWNLLMQELGFVDWED